MKRHIKFISIALATMFTFSGNLVSAYALATSADSSSNFKYLQIVLLTLNMGWVILIAIWNLLWIGIQINYHHLLMIYRNR